MGLVLNQTAGFGRDPYDGIFGLSLLALGVSPEFFPALIRNGSVAEPRYGFYLTLLKVGNPELTLGGIDESKITSDIHYIPINK